MTPSCPRASASPGSRAASVVGSVRRGITSARGTLPARVSTPVGGSSHREAAFRRDTGDRRDRRHRQRPRARSTSSRLPNRVIVVWKGCGLPSGWRAMTSPSRMSSRAGERPCHLDHLGHGGGDVVEARESTPAPPRRSCGSARERHRASTRARPRPAPPAPLTRPPPIRPASAEPDERAEPRSARGRSRPPLGQPERPVAVAPPSSRLGAPLPEGAGPRAATASAMTPSRAPWRTSPARRPERNPCSSRVSRESSVGQETTLFGRRTLAIYCRNAIEDRAHLGQLHESLTCRLTSGVAQRGPAHPQSLGNDAAEICGGDLDFGGRNAAEKVGQEPHLVAAAARVGDSAGCFDQLGKLHDGEGLRAKR